MIGNFYFYPANFKLLLLYIESIFGGECIYPLVSCLSREKFGGWVLLGGKELRNAGQEWIS